MLSSGRCRALEAVAFAEHRTWMFTEISELLLQAHAIPPLALLCDELAAKPSDSNTRSGRVEFLPNRMRVRPAVEGSFLSVGHNILHTC